MVTEPGNFRRKQRLKSASGAPEKTVEPGELKVENTETDPAELLQRVEHIEARLNDDQMIRCGRERRQRFGEQSMGSYDLDYDQLKIHHDYLVETFPG